MIDVSLSDVRSSVGNGPVLIRLLLQSRRSKCFFASQILLFQAASLRSQYMTTDQNVVCSNHVGCTPQQQRVTKEVNCLDTSWTLLNSVFRSNEPEIQAPALQLVTGGPRRLIQGE
jgi:hypothetical protein